MKTTKLWVTTPDGTVLSRKTHRTYTHAVCVKRTYLNGTWRAIHWCGRRDLADKAAAGITGAVILPVEGKPVEQQIADAKAQHAVSENADPNS